MAELIKHFQKAEHVSANSVEHGDQNDIEAIPAGICRKPVQAETLGHEFHWLENHVANCVASSAPEQAQKSRAVTKLNGLKTNTMGNINQIPKP